MFFFSVNAASTPQSLTLNDSGGAGDLSGRGGVSQCALAVSDTGRLGLGRFSGGVDLGGIPQVASLRYR